MSSVQNRQLLSLNIGDQQKTIDVAETKTTQMGRILAKLGLVSSAETKNSRGSTVHVNVNSLYKRQ